MAVGRRLRKWLAWGTLLLLCVLGGALGFAYTYVTDSSNLTALIRENAPRFLPGSLLEVGRVQLRPLLGQITLHHVKLWQKRDQSHAATGQIGWLNIRLDFHALMNGKYQPKEIVLAQPQIRLWRRSDGSWNFQRLLADPWPAPPLETDPTILITGGSIQLVDGTGPDAETKILSDVSLRADPTSRRGTYKFVADARGGPFDRTHFEGQIDLRSGRIDITRGELLRLNVSPSFCRCLPPHLRERFQALGLTTGELDLSTPQFSFVPDDPEPFHAVVNARLRGGTLTHPSLPDSLNQLEAVATLRGDTLAIERADARNGKTTLGLRGNVSWRDPTNGPLDLQVEVTDLELDQRLRRQTPQWEVFWADYKPEGWIDLAARIVRTRPNEPPRFGLTVQCKDVGMLYHQFPYPLQHMRGSVVWQGSTTRVDLRTLIGGEWATAKGTIENPGPHAVVKVDLASNAFPVDDTLMNALAPDVRRVVQQYHPTGSVRGTAHVLRESTDSTGRLEKIQVSGEFDINPGSSMRWDGMPYLIRDLSGRLEFSPDRWVLKNVKGTNGTAGITASGEVIGPRPGHQAVALDVHAEHLPFEPQLRDALPPEWQSTWATLNPSGECQVDAHIQADPGSAPHYHLRIVPGPQSRIRLTLTPVGPAPGTFTSLQLPPMENISGTFLFDDGVVHMNDVEFWFREAPVEVRGGTVVLRDTGEFSLAVDDLLVTKLRLDSELRKIMPPMMAEFARRVDDGRPFRLRGNLRIGWNGQPGQPARCSWDKTTVVFDGNTVEAGVPIEQIQGQFDNASGWSDGHSIALKGRLNLESVRLAGQQITKLVAPIVLDQTGIRVEPLQAQILGGAVSGKGFITLDPAPKYQASVELRDADLMQYARTLPGLQSLRGRVSGRVDLAGRGTDIRAITGNGWARVQDGALGELPMALTWAKVPNFRPPTKTAFDAAEVHFQLAGGEAVLQPVRFTGDAFSLNGAGTLRLQGDRELDLHLSPVYGRDERRVPIVSEVVREASGRVFDVHITGPVTNATARPEPLPDVLTRTSRAVRRLSEPRGDRVTADNEPRTH